MSDPIDPHTEGVLIRHGLVKPKVRCMAGERFETFERGEFKRNRNAFDDAIRAAVVAMEDANFTAEDIKAFKGQVDDFCGDTWNVDPRKED